MKRKICCVITARPSYSRIKSALIEVKRNPDMELQIVLTSSALLDRYGPINNTLAKDGLTPDSVVYNVLEGENLVTSAKTTSIAILELSSVFERLKPDAVITVADRFETMATAITASYMNIPLVHVQGGEVTGSIDEKVRHAVTKLSDVHFVSNQDAFNRVIKLGESPEKTFITGCPSIDLVLDTKKSDHSVNKELCDLGVGYDIDPNSEEYLVVMQHPVTTEWGKSGEDTKETLEAIKKIDKPVFWFWPNADAGSDSTSRVLRKYRENSKDGKVRFLKNLPPEEFLRLLMNSMCLVGNSSVGMRECGILGLPVVNIGTRQQGRLRSENILDVGHDAKEIEEKVRIQIEHGPYKSSFLYGDGSAGKKISDLLSSVPLSVEKRITY